MTKFTHPKDAPEGHKWQTREGEPVRILCHDANGDHPIVALVGAGKEVTTYSKEGLFFLEEGEYSMDLIDAPTPEQWVNVYRGESNRFYFGVPFSSLEAAQEQADSGTIGVMLLK